MRKIFGKGLLGLGLFYMYGSPIFGILNAIELGIMGALIIAFMSFFFGVILRKLGRIVLGEKDLVLPEEEWMPFDISGYNLLTWLVILGGAGFVILGIDSWISEDYTNGGRAITGGFAIFTLGIGMLRKK